MRGRPAPTPWKATAALAVSTLVLLSCSSTRTATGAPTGATSTARGSPSPLRTAAGDTALVQTLGVQPSDVPAGYMVVVVAGGERVEASATLDMCDASFPSEKLRTAHRQVAVVDKQLQNRFSTDAVLYQSPVATEQAFAELRDAQAHCPPTYQAPANSDAIPLKTTFNPPPDAGWAQIAGVDRLAFDITLSDQQGRTLRTVAVYLRRGRVVLGLYFPQTNRPPIPIEGHTTTQAIVAGFATRLTRLPAGAVS